MSEIIQLSLLQRDGEVSTCEILFPPAPPWFIRFGSPTLGTKIFEDDDLFECLRDIRRFLEEKGWSIVCNGARGDVYPSPMSRQMGGGRKSYVLRIGMQAHPSSLVDIFDPTTPDKISSVAEQDDFHKRWVESLG